MGHSPILFVGAFFLFLCTVLLFVWFSVYHNSDLNSLTNPEYWMFLCFSIFILALGFIFLSYVSSKGKDEEEKEKKIIYASENQLFQPREIIVPPHPHYNRIKLVYMNSPEEKLPVYEIKI